VDSYDLGALVGSQVRRITFDDRVSLLLVDDARVEQRVIANLAIEAAIAFCDSEGADHEIRPGVPASLSPILQLLRRRVTAVTFDGRELAVSLDDRSRFSVFTGERYEAWNLHGLGIPNLVAGPWSITDGSPESYDDDHDGAEGSGRTPPAVEFPVYGMSPSFTGRRALGVWDRMMGEQFVGVLLDHGGPDEQVQVTIGTIAKSSPLLLAPEDQSAGPRVTGFEAALSQSLFGLLQLEMPNFGEERSVYLRERLPEMDRLAMDVGSPVWERSFVSVAGLDCQAHVYRLGRSWAAAVDLDDRVGLALWGRGMEPTEIELVEIDELDAYREPVAEDI